jgi:hypothetical protein
VKSESPITDISWCYNTPSSFNNSNECSFSSSNYEGDNFVVGSCLDGKLLFISLPLNMILSDFDKSKENNIINIEGI